MGIGPLPGIVARVASRMYLFDVAHAKSFTWSATKRHTSRSPATVAWPGPNSSSPTIVTSCIGLEHVRQPLARLSAVYTCSGFCSTPVPLTSQPAGNVDADVEAAEVVVELRRSEILVRVPAAQIVVLRDARKPLRRLEEVIAAGAAPCDGRCPALPAASSRQPISSVAFDLGAIGVGSVMTRASVEAASPWPCPAPGRLRGRWIGIVDASRRRH